MTGISDIANTGVWAWCRGCEKVDVQSKAQGLESKNSQLDFFGVAIKATELLTFVNGMRLLARKVIGLHALGLCSLSQVERIHNACKRTCCKAAYDCLDTGLTMTCQILKPHWDMCITADASPH